MQKPDRWDFDKPEQYRDAMNKYDNHMNNQMRKMTMNAIVGGTFATLIGITALTVIGGSWYTVDEGYRGVALRNGAVIGTSEPGLGFKMPIIDSVIDITRASS